MGANVSNENTTIVCGKLISNFDYYWMISYRDDHSRFITGSVKIWKLTGENAIKLLDRQLINMEYLCRS